MSSPNIDFVYSHKWFGTWVRDRVTMPSTHTWKQVREELSKYYGKIRAIRREWDSACWPGGYPMFYVVKDSGVLCPRCANLNLSRTLDPDDSQFFIVGVDANYEDPELYCDHCNERIPTAYVEDDRKDHEALWNELQLATAQGAVGGDTTRFENADKAYRDWIAKNPCFQGNL